MDNQAFWLGAEVGRTESISHVPTQITNYKGSATPLSDKELSFFKGYLLRSGVAKKFTVQIRHRIRMRNSNQYNNGYAFLQDETLSASNSKLLINFIILNDKGQKILANGNIADDNNVSYFNSRNNYTLTLSAGKYYCRIISSICTTVDEDDFEFIVSGNTSVNIDHYPKMIKLNYHCGGLSEVQPLKPIDDYINRNSSAGIKGNLTWSRSIEYPTTLKFDYDVDSVTLSGMPDISRYFDFQWYKGSHINYQNGYVWGYGNNNYGVSIGHYDGVPRSTTQKYSSGEYPPYAIEYVKSINGFWHSYYGVTQDYGYDNELLATLNMSCKYDNTSIDKNFKLYIPNSMKVHMNVSSDIWGIGEIHGVVYGEYWTDYSVSYIKNTHPVVSIPSFEVSRSLDSEVEVLDGKDTGVSPFISFYDVFTSLYSKIKTILTNEGYSVSTHLNGVSDGRCELFWYYETDDGIIEANNSNGVRYPISSNPTIEDDSKITKAFIAAPIFYNEIKEGYENYFE